MQRRKGLFIGANSPRRRTSTLGSGPGKLFWIASLQLCVFALNAVLRVNVVLGIFGGVALLGGLCRAKPVRDRLHRMRVAFVTWVDAV
jgi:hypothetical protein